MSLLRRTAPCVRVYRGTWQAMTNSTLDQALNDDPGTPPAIWVTTERDEARNYAMNTLNGPGFTHVLHLSMADDELLHIEPRDDRSDTRWPADLNALRDFEPKRAAAPSTLSTSVVQWDGYGLEAIARGVVAVKYSHTNRAVLDTRRLSVLGRQRASIE